MLVKLLSVEDVFLPKWLKIQGILKGKIDTFFDVTDTSSRILKH